MKNPAIAEIVHHELKEWTGYFGSLWDGTRTHEIRKDDRRIPFAAGHTVKISEVTQDRQRPTGRFIRGLVTAVTRGINIGSNAGLPPGVCVFTFREIGRGGYSPDDTSITPNERGRA